jgi:exosortase N
MGFNYNTGFYCNLPLFKIFKKSFTIMVIKNLTIERKYFMNIFLRCKLNKTFCQLCCFILVYLLAVKYFLSNYFIIDASVVSALLFSPYIISPNPSLPSNFKYAFLSGIFLTLAIITGVKTFYFFTIGLAMLFAIESMAGAIGYQPLYLLGLLSPTFAYFNNMLGFPVRLKLSEWAGYILQSIGYKNEVAGNIIVLNGTEFSVDPACVGLKMIAFSLLAGLLIMAYFQKFSRKPFSFLTSTGILAIVIVLNIFANLIRIVTLTIFKILPNNPLHEILGTICFLVYVIAPTYFLIKRISALIPERSITEKTSKNTNPNKILLINILLAIIITIAGFRFLGNQQTSAAHLPSISLQGYSGKVVGEDILKFEKSGLLVYIKPLSRFYGAEHNPMICWVGSGYQFRKINKEKIEGKEIYTGILKKGNDTIYAAWWFDSGKHKTNSQLDWRWRALKGENFSLVNVNSENPEILKWEIRNLLKTNAFINK